MILRRSALAAALLAVACSGPEPDVPPRAQERLGTLRAAFAERSSRPAEAARLFEDAGAGPALERARLEAWLEALGRSAAGSERWRAFLDAAPPGDLAQIARAGLGRALLDEGREAEGVAELEAALEAGERRAAELLLVHGDPAVRERAARRLAVADPPILRRVAPELEAAAVRDLPPEGWLERGRAWREAGRPTRARAELGARRFRGAEERDRRLELARAEIASGAAAAALARLPAAGRSSAEELLVRAEANRRLGWSRVPSPSARAPFRACRDAAEAAGGPDADRLVIECATEAGEVDRAVETWRSLGRSAGTLPRDEWLGRRLALAAAAGGRPDTALEIASQLPDHLRCVRYWTAAPPSRREQLLRLAAAGVADLYGVWAREELGLEPSPAEQRPPPDPVPTALPPTVRLLLTWGEEAEAVQEWARIAETRGLAPGEAAAAAELARSRGRANAAIRWLRQASPELGGVELDRVPASLARAYLPLEWEERVREVAARFDLDPWLVAAVARQESVFVPGARSPAGAVGVLQLVPGTARRHALALGLGPRPDLTDPELNLLLGARELAGLIERFGAVEPALAAYNAGEARARRWWRAWPERRSFVEKIPIPETYTYVRRVVYLADAYRVVYAGPSTRHDHGSG